MHRRQSCGIVNDVGRDVANDCGRIDRTLCLLKNLSLGHARVGLANAARFGGNRGLAHLPSLHHDLLTAVGGHARADDFEKFLDALNLRPVIGIGHSSGATAVAVTAGRRPELIARAVLIEPTVRVRVLPDTSPGYISPMVERTRSRRSRWPDRATLYSALLQRPPYLSWADELKALFADYAVAPNAQGELELLCPPGVEADIYASFLRFDPWPDLARVRQPVLVIHGSGPSIMSTTRVAEVMPALPTARLVELPEGGHLILMEAPQAVAAVVREFLHEND